MVAQSNPIIIQGWQKGIGASPYVGFGKMVGLDIFRKPGIIQSGVNLVNTAVNYAGFITAEVVDSNGNIFAGTNNGFLYKNGAQYQSGLGQVHDLLIIQDCLLVVRNGANIDLLANISIGGGNYLSSWKTGLNQSIYGWKKTVLGQDNVIYIGNETQLASITGFTNPYPISNTPTGSLSTSCLATGLPAGRIIQTICELNRYIAISTSLLGNAYGNTVMYFMDRGILNASRTSFFLSIGVEIPERIVRQLIAQNNRLYFFGNDTGTFYETDTTTYTQIAVIPNKLPAQQYNNSSPYTPNSIALVENEILFGVGGGFNSAFDTIYGVYSIRGRSLICKQIISSGDYGQTNSISIGAITVIGAGSYHVAWQDGSTVGNDICNFNIGTGFNVWFESAIYEVAEALTPRTFQTAQFNFGAALSSAQALKLYYRSGNNETWVLYATYSYISEVLTITYNSDNSITTVTHNILNHFSSKFSVTFKTNIQIKVAFDVGTEQVYGQNIELKSITLI